MFRYVASSLLFVTAVTSAQPALPDIVGTWKERPGEDRSWIVSEQDGEIIVIQAVMDDRGIPHFVHSRASLEQGALHLRFEADPAIPAESQAPWLTGAVRIRFSTTFNATLEAGGANIALKRVVPTADEVDPATWRE